MPTRAPRESADDVSEDLSEDRSDDLSYLEIESAVSALASGGDGEAARVRLRDFIGQHPGCAEAHNDLGVLMYEAGDLPAAAAAIDRAIALHPDRARYHRNRALVLLTKNELSAALVALSRALALDPEDEETKTIARDLEAARRQSQAPRPSLLS
jgi:tetratricopeptide (TPR) repeat protein